MAVGSLRRVTVIEISQRQLRKGLVGVIGSVKFGLQPQRLSVASSEPLPCTGRTRTCGPEPEARGGQAG